MPAITLVGMVRLCKAMYLLTTYMKKTNQTLFDLIFSTYWQTEKIEYTDLPDLVFSIYWCEGKLT